jgi:LytS/YehU family sensor histidine kinase
MVISIIWYRGYPFLLWSTIYFGYKFWEVWNEQKIRTERERLLAQAAQLEMLRYQLNPHFLFNTLSSLRALVRVNIEKAEEMITQISEFLRYSLLEGKNSEVPLSKEIEIVKHYLDIEKVRFGDKLIIDYQIDQLAEDYPVPVFLIHPLIENAIKHGMKSNILPLKIVLKAEVSDGSLNIDVINTGKWIESVPKEDTNNTGTGLKNTLKRLEHAYPNNHTFEILKGENTVHVRMKVKKELERNLGKKV